MSRQTMPPLVKTEEVDGKIPALIIDDEPMACKAVKSIIERHGFDAEIISDPQDFPNAYRLSTQLIVLDLHMPHIDGIEVLRFLGDHQSPAAIILLSGAQNDVLRASADLGAGQGLRILGALRKPLQAESLIQLLKEFRRPPDPAQQMPRYEPVHTSLFRGGSTELPSVDDVHDAIKGRQMEVYFQPKIGLPDQSFAGVEALVRWQHPIKGTVPPDYLVPFAEKFGLINDLTDLVIDTACAHYRHLTNNRRCFEISINVSEKSLDNLDLPEILVQKVEAGGLLPGNTVLEITETTFSSDPKHRLDILTRLRLKGFRLSIDDFGTGHSSLARLRQIPFSEMKIDKMFVGAADTDPGSRAIVGNTIELANRLGLSIVAEGVETDAQLKILEDLGCGKIQGYLYSKPLKIDAFQEWLKSWEKRRPAA